MTLLTPQEKAEQNNFAFNGFSYDDNQQNRKELPNTACTRSPAKCAGAMVVGLLLRSVRVFRHFAWLGVDSGLVLQGWTKSEIARKVQRSRRWVHRWISRYEPEATTKSLQDHSRAPKQIRWAYLERIKRMAVQTRVERERGKRAKYQYALVSA